MQETAGIPCPCTVRTVCGMRDEEYAGYCCLAIAILCNLNADEARKMYEYGPEHPLCRKILRRKVHMAGLETLDRRKSGEVMEALLKQGYSVDAVSEAFYCFPSTVRRRTREARTKAKREEDDPAPLKQEAEWGCWTNSGMEKQKKEKRAGSRKDRGTFIILHHKERKETNGKPEDDRKYFYRLQGPVHGQTSGGDTAVM